MTAAHKSGYVILSPSEKAVKAVLAERRTADKFAEGDHVALIGRSDIAVHVNMKVVGPIYEAFMKAMAEQMKGMGAPRAPLDMTKIMGMYSKLLGQIDALTFSARLTSANVIIEEMVSLTPGSDMAKATLATVRTAPQLDSLTNLPYVFAFSSVMTQDKAAIDISRKMASGMFDSLIGLLPKETVAKINKLNDKFLSQVTGVQMVIGGAPTGSGLFGVSCVLTCKDSSKVKGMLADSASLIQDLIRSIDPNDRDLQKLSISYQKGVETSATLPVDAIEISHPDIADMDEGEREDMKKILGEDKIRALIVAPDKNTVVVTFGGAMPFVDEAVKAARGGGKLLTRTQLRAMKKYMPAKPTGMGLFSVGNLLEVILTGVKTMEPDAAAAIPFTIRTKDPVVIAGGVTGKAAHVVIAVPVPLIKEVAQAVQMMLGQMMGGSGPMPGPPDDDF